MVDRSSLLAEDAELLAKMDEAFGEQGDDSSTPADDEEEFGEDA